MTLDIATQAEPRSTTQRASDVGSKLWLVSLCFFLSGLAALLYQTAWMRQFAAVFGTSEPAVAAVLAAYMSGLALGAAAAGKWLTRVRRPILVYGLLELGIAMGAIALPVGLHLARTLFHKYTGGLPALPDAGGGGQFGFYLAATFLLVLIPTSFMGATLPLLARHAVQRESQIGQRIGSLYAINTVGAVVGTVVAAFMLLPRIGLQATVWVGVAVNAVVFLLAIAVARNAPICEATDTAEDAPRKTSTFSFVLPLMALSGAIAFTYEVLWTRLLGHLLGGSIYAFATMLASFLTGIAIGSAIAARKAKTREQAVRGFVVAQFGVAVFSLAIYSSLELLPGLQATLSAGEDAGIAPNAILAALVLLPATLCLGATFPFAVRIAASTAEEAGRASARVFSWNTVGGTVGALAAGFVILPALEFEGTIRLCVLGNLTLAVVAHFFSEAKDLRGRVTAVAGVAIVAVFFQPTAPTSILSSSPFAELGNKGEVVWSRVGSSCSALVVKKGDEYQVRVNGLPQALVVPRGAPPLYGLHNRWLSALPLLARPDAKRMCVIGLGGGVALEELPATLEQIEVIELSHEVVAANRFLSSLRNADPLADPRVRIVENDARSAFERTTDKWDVIVSQPSHPWTAGASHLFTQEFAQLVREHLTPGGAFLQWVSTRSFNMDLLKTYGATLLAEFKYVRLYQSSTACPLFLASDEPLAIEEALLEHRGLLDSAPEYTSWLGLDTPEDVAARMTLDTAGLRELCRDTKPNSDDANRLALRPPSISGHTAWVDMEQLLAPLADRELDPRFDKLQLIRRLLDLEFVRRAETLAARIEDAGSRAYAESLIAMRTGKYQLGQEKLFQAQDLSPRDPNIAYEVLARELGVKLTERGERARLALDSGGLSVAAAWPHLVAEDWARLERLDDSLAKAKSDQPWYFLSLQLRALWRVHGDATGEVARARALEAIRLVDRAIAIGPNVALLAIRAEAADRAGEAEVLIESASLMVAIIQNVGDSPSNRNHGANVAACLARLQGDERVDADRLNDLQIRLRILSQSGFRGSFGQAE